MKTEHPITPPPVELVQEWLNTPRYSHAPKDGIFVVQKCHSLSNSEVMALAEQAARWGADQELEACCEWLVVDDWKNVSENLRAARRPKPPSLKEQALQALYRFDDTQGHEGLTPEQIADDFVLIRRALEALPDV